MILRCEPVLKALAAVLARGAEIDLASVQGPAAAETASGRRPRVILFAPTGKTFTQSDVRRLAGEEHLVFLCGHYEGMDARIYEYADEILSIGDYVLSGGEIAAMVVMDAVTRLLPGNLREASTEDESFEHGLLEYPQYTRPAEYDGKRVPEVLLSGNHEAIASWRHTQSLELTKRLRPDLYEAYMKRMLADQ